MKIPLFPGKYHQHRWIFQPAMLVYRSVSNGSLTKESPWHSSAANHRTSRHLRRSTTATADHTYKEVRWRDELVDPGYGCCIYNPRKLAWHWKITMFSNGWFSIGRLVLQEMKFYPVIFLDFFKKPWRSDHDAIKIFIVHGSCSGFEGCLGEGFSILSTVFQHFETSFFDHPWSNASIASFWVGFGFEIQLFFDILV